MVQDDGMHWELLNNEIRRITRSGDNNTITFTTGFRSIKNELIFENVVWSDDVESLQGEVINYVQEISMENITMDICERLRKNYSTSFEIDFERNNRVLYKIVSNRSRNSLYLVAGNLKIVVNG